MSIHDDQKKKRHNSFLSLSYFISYMNLPRKKKTKEEKMKPFLWARKKNSNENRCVKQRGKNQRPLRFLVCPVFCFLCSAHGRQWSCH